jgi:hypothetical protein
MSHRETEAISTARRSAVATITPAYGNLIEPDQTVRGLALRLVSVFLVVASRGTSA